MEHSQVEIGHLPDEVMLKIFSYLTPKYILTSVVDVCNQWKSIVESDYYFWENLQIIVMCNKFINNSFLVDSDIQSAYTCCQQACPNFEPFNITVGEKDLIKVPKVRKLRLEGDCKETLQPETSAIQVVEIISKMCLDIKHVVFFQSAGSVSNVFLTFLNDTYSNLQVISYGPSAVWRIPYEELLRFKNLHTLISHDYQILRKDLNLIAKMCNQLNCLWLLFARSFLNVDLICFLEASKQTIQELGIGCSVNDLVLQKVKECTRLKVLFFSDARQITKEGLANLTDMPKLKYLSLHRAKVELQVLSDWIVNSTVRAQLRILDLSDYYFKHDTSFAKIYMVILI